MGDYTVERFLVVSVVYLLVLLALIFTKKKRQILIVLIAIVLVGYLIFFFVRGKILEEQYEESIKIVNEFLENKYPEEEWAVIDKLSKGQKRKSNTVYIVFENEKDIIYTYKKMDDGEVVQWEIYLGGKQSEDLKHNE
ncbi:Na+-translocating ferredoxin:NAD+ oxidoreductase RnfG subunit [Sporosarcina luteola]|nr:Na+-translocating ferredoxin:NAD+ oxidoreductase RnfG subunit [Sporosarcina luteola]